MKSNNIEVGRIRRNNTLTLVAKFGHIRPVDLAIFFNTNPKIGSSPNLLKAAERTLKKLYKEELLISRKNGLGSTSYVLSHAGAVYVKQNGLYAYARTGKDLSCTDSTFYHHCITTIGFMLLINISKEISINKIITESEVNKKIDPTYRNDFDLFSCSLP